MKSSEGSKGACKDTSMVCQFTDEFYEKVVPMHNLKLNFLLTLTGCLVPPKLLFHSPPQLNREQTIYQKAHGSR